MADITEIIEESAVQLEIVETGGGQLEIVDGSSTIIEIVETTIGSNGLDIIPQTNTLVVETPSDSTIVDISVSDPTTIETTITNNVIDIIEPSLTIISTQSITNIITETERNVEGTLTVSGSLLVTGSVTISGSNTFTNIGPLINKGDINTEGSLTVSNTLFTDIISASIAQFNGDGTNNILIISSGSNSPITINPSGLIVFDQFTYTPPPIEGGFLYSGSDFFIGLTDS